MTLNQFIKMYNIQPADALVVKKDFIGLLDHYLIYLGYYNNEHKFIANYTKGTRILTYPELEKFSQYLIPNRIKKFNGNEIQRSAAVQRALSRKDQTSYHLLLNNCEHYANYVQSGVDISQQTTTFGTTMALTGLATAAMSKDTSTRGIGLVMAGLGLLTLLIDKD